MFVNRTIDRLEKMLEAAKNGSFLEKTFDESTLSRLECNWKNYIENTELSKQNIAAEKENIKSLVSDISHQTKTPMANIKLYAALLEESIATGSEDRQMQLQVAGELCRQVEKLEFLTQALSKISRLESDVYELIPQNQRIYPMLLDILEQIRPKAEDKKIRICCQPEDENEREQNGEGEGFFADLCASFDRKWTKEALFNVVDNAVKYSPGGAAVTIYVKKYEMYVAILVRDEGMGIDEGEIPKIFERFYRGSSVQQTEGAGIGLYLAREILKKEKGYIKVKSKPGKGAEFGIYLPRG